MWCLPLVEQTNALLPDVDVVATLIGQRRIELSTVLSTPVQHVFTHRRWQLSVAIFTLGQRPRPRRGQVWLRLEEHPPGGLPSVTRKMMARLAASGTLAAPPRTPIR
jgi:adenine-specific DNA glycosylase